MNRAERRRLGVKADLLEQSWQSLAKTLKITPASHGLQYVDMRRCFFSGAAGLFSILMTVLDPGHDATDRDLAQMDAIDEELRVFAEAIGTPFEVTKKGTMQ